MTVTISSDLSGLDAYLDQLGEDAEEAARPAAQAAAQVYYNKVKANVSVLGKKTGNLDRSIYQAYSVDRSGEGRATYHVSWNHKKAPHGHLIEFGHWQRYLYYQGNDGKVRPMIRPGMEDKPRPRRRASQAEKDAYYVPRPGGPVWVPGKFFIRDAQKVSAQALEAAKAELLRRMKLEV